MTANLGKKVAALESARGASRTLLGPSAVKKIFIEVCICHGIDPSSLLEAQGSLNKAIAALLGRLTQSSRIGR